MDVAKAKAAVAALCALREAVVADREQDYNTRPFNGFVDMLGRAFDEDFGYLQVREDFEQGLVMLPSIQMAIACGEQMLSASQQATTEQRVDQSK